MICFANAKVNIGLYALEKRNDGYHNIETCIVPVPVYDILEVRKSSSFSLIQSGRDIDCKAEDNLITLVWDLLSKNHNNLQPVEVYLYKNIPVGSGMGGGSSNAAFFLKLINNFNNLNLSVQEMEYIAGKVGSDCPFFINNKPVVASEKGNKLKTVNNPLSGKYVTIVFSGCSISTKQAFENLNKLSNKPGLEDLLKQEIHTWKNIVRNDFEEKLLNYDRSLHNIRSSLYNSGAEYVSLTGTGSAIYGVSNVPIICDALKMKYSVWQLRIKS